MAKKPPPFMAKKGAKPPAKGANPFAKAGKKK